MARLETRVRKDFFVTDKPSKLVVDFECNVAFGKWKHVYFEDGSGHGGSLRIAHFRREAAGVAVRMIDYRHYQNRNLEVRAGNVDATAFDAIVAEARAAMLVRPHLIPLAEPNQHGVTGGASFSTRDFHRRVTIVDDEDRITDARFTGYESSRDQDRILPLRYASEPLQKLIAAASLVVAPATDEDKKLFTERLQTTLSEDPAWWVKERYVAVAARLGTVDAIPSLSVLLASSLAPKGGVSEDRTRDGVLEAIASITRWDPRVDSEGKPRSPDLAAALVVEECTLPPPPPRSLPSSP